MRDVGRIVIRSFRNLFYYLEENNFLDPLLEVDLFALHVVYNPRINRALQEFKRQHNNHPLRTEHSSTPLQLFCTPILEGTYNPPTVHPHLYGGEEDGPVPLEHNNSILVDPVNVNLNERQLNIVHQQINPLEEDDNFGVSIYFYVRQLIQSFLV